MKRFCGFALLLLSPIVSAQSQSDGLEQARALFQAGKLQAAEQQTRHYLNANPGSADGYFLLGDIFFRERKARESLAAFTDGARYRHPGAAELRTVASDYVLLGDYADADKWFTMVTGETPDDADAWYLLGRTKYNENRFAEAVGCFQHTLALHPRDLSAEDNLGLAQQGLGQSDKAKEAYENAIAWQGSAPTDAQPFLNLGILLRESGDAAAAVSELKKAAALAPANPKAREELGRALESAGDLPGALSELEAAVQLAPNAAGLHFKLGQLYRRAGKNDRAQQEFAICEKLNGTHSSTEVPNPFSPEESHSH